MADTRIVLATLRRDPRLSAEQGVCGCVGFCLGGRLGMRAAAEFGESLQAAALLRWSYAVTGAENSAHRGLASVAA